MINIRLKTSSAIIFPVILCLFCFTNIAFAGKKQDIKSDSIEAAVDSALTVSGRLDKLSFSSGGKFDILGMIAKMTLYLMLIVAMIFGVLYFLKKFVYNRKDLLGKNKAINVLSTTFIAPKKSLLLVEALDRVLILGVTDNQMNLITEIPKSEYSEYLNNSDEQKPAGSQPAGQFSDILTKILKRPK